MTRPRGLRASCYGVFDRTAAAHNEMQTATVVFKAKLPFYTPVRIVVLLPLTSTRQNTRNLALTTYNLHDVVEKK